VSTAIWIAICIALSLIGVAWLSIVAREIRGLLQPAEEDQ
jgi:hypothetical protein